MYRIMNKVANTEDLDLLGIIRFCKNSTGISLKIIRLYRFSIFARRTSGMQKEKLVGHKHTIADTSDQQYTVHFI